MNKPKKHDNHMIQNFLAAYYRASDLCDEFPRIDDIFSGVLELKTTGDTSTRSLSRQVLFHILQWCPVIDIESVNAATNGQYAYSTLASYAALARVASKSIEGFIKSLPDSPRRLTIRQSQQALDEPYRDELLALAQM